MRPNDPYYGVHKLAEAPQLDATLNYVATRSPVSNPYARYLNAEKLGRDEMVQNSRTISIRGIPFTTANPQEILDRGEKVTLVPLLIMQGELDDNVRPPCRKNSLRLIALRAGSVNMKSSPAATSMGARAGPQTDRAHEMVKAFIARQLKAKRLAA